MAGLTLVELDRKLEDRSWVTVAIVRDGETEIPRGSSRIEAGDHIYVLSRAEDLPAVPPLAGYERFNLERVMIAGGNREAVYLARHLNEHEVACTILDVDRHRSQELAEELPNALVLHGDATDQELLEMEGVAGIDGFVSLTGQDETNLLAGLLAKTVGARRAPTRRPWRWRCPSPHRSPESRWSRPTFPSGAWWAPSSAATRSSHPVATTRCAPATG